MRRAQYDGVWFFRKWVNNARELSIVQWLLYITLQPELPNKVTVAHVAVLIDAHREESLLRGSLLAPCLSDFRATIKLN